MKALLLLALLLSSCAPTLAATSYVTGQIIAVYMPDPIKESCCGTHCSK
jgi:hypothetical protein